MTCAPVQCNAKRTLYSHFTLHTPHLSSSHLVPSLLTCHPSKFFSTVFISSEHWSTFLISSKFFSTHPSCSARQRALTVRQKSLAEKNIRRRKLLHTEAWDTDAFTQRSLYKILCTTKLAQSTSPTTTLYYKACTRHFPVLLCTTKLAQPSTTFYYKACTIFSLALLCTTKLAQSTSQHYFYYKACTKRFPVLLCTAKLAQKQAFSTQKNKRFRAPASSPKQTPCNIRAAITMPFAAASTHSCSHYHYIAICIHALQNTKGEPITRQNERSATAAQTRYPSSPPACSHFSRKNTRFHAPASSPKQTLCNIRAAITMR